MQKARRPVDQVKTYFFQEWASLAIVAVTGLLYNAGIAAGPWFEGQLAQCLFDIMNGSRVLADMVVLAVLYVTVLACVQVMRYFKRLFVRRFANNANREMKCVLYRGLVSQSKPQLDEQGAGPVMTKAIGDVDACVEGMRKVTTELFDTGVAMVSFLVMLLVYDWRLTLLCCVFPPISYVIAQHMKRVVQRASAAAKESAGRLNATTLDRVSGAITYRVFGQETARDTAYEGALSDYQQAAVRINVWETALQPLYRVIALTSVVLIIFFGARNVMGDGWTTWDIASFTTFLLCYTKLATKTSSAAKLFNAVQKAQVSWARIKPFLTEAGNVADREEPSPVAAACATRDHTPLLEVEQLSFSYPSGLDVLHNISFAVKKGQVVGVTGPVASGKSTLGTAFLCEYPYRGSVRVCGSELASLSAAERSALVAYSGHDPELLSDSIAENICLGDCVDVDNLLRAVCLDKEVAALPHGVRTRVGAKGVRLSGGQQARVALARTLAHARPLMVLDDPFSAVDRATEAQLMRGVRAWTGESATLVLSHRLYLFPEFDQVIWMEHGHAWVGTHASLMHDCPAYAVLYRAQVRGGEGCESAE